MTEIEFCTIKDGAKILRVSRPTVYKRIEQGKLGVYTVLGRPALKLSEVMELKRLKKKPNGNGHK
jgi:excisionase family DNA binding protein